MSIGVNVIISKRLNGRSDRGLSEGFRREYVIRLATRDFVFAQRRLQLQVIASPEVADIEVTIGGQYNAKFYLLR